MRVRLQVSLWLAMLLLLAGCAASSPASNSAADMDTAAIEAPMPQASASESARVAESDGDAADGNGNAAGGGNFTVMDTRRVITTGRMELVVQDAGAAADQITALATEVGGYVGTTNLYQAAHGSGQALRGSITLRIPAENLDRVIDELEALAIEVRSENMNRQDVTDQFADTEAQLRALTATEVELLELLSEVRAKPNATADEIMAVYQRITEIRTEIERLQGRLNLLDNQVRLSTLEISLIPDTVNLPLVEEGWRPAGEAREALRTLVTATQGFADLLIWAALFVLPMVLLMLIPLAIVGYILRLIFRWVSRKAKAARATEPTG